MASSDATPLPVKNQAFRVTFPIYDNDGDLVTGAAALDSEVSKDGASFADCTNEATEIGSSGMYYLDLSSTEMNADTVVVIVKTTTTDAKTTPIVLYPQADGLDRSVNITHWNGTAVPAENTAGYPIVTIKDGTGAGEIALTSGAIDNVTLVATTTTNTDMRGTDSAALASALTAHDGKLDTVDANIDAVLLDTAEIGAAGAGLTAVPWNSAWDAEVQSEVTDALNAYDPPTNAELEARTLLAADYFDPTADTVANVNTVATTTTNTDMRGTDGANTTAPDNASIAAILADTAELQADWTNGGRLDLILDIIAADTTTDIPALIAALENLSAAQVAAELATYDGPTRAELTSDKDEIITQVNANETKIDTIDANVDLVLADTAELQTNQGDWLTATGFSTHSAADVWAATTRTLSSYGTLVADVATAVWGAATRTLTAFGFAVETDSASRTASQADVSGLATSAAVSALNDLSTADIDARLAAIHLDHLLAAEYDPASKPGAATALFNELIESDAGVSRFTANSLEQAPSGGGGGGDATEAKQDTIIANLATVDGIVDAIFADTDTAIPAQISALNDISEAEVNAQVDAALADYDPPTKAELDAGLAALNDLSAAQVNAEVDTALTDYDGPTNAELTTAQGVITTAISALNDISTADIDNALATYDGPTKAEMDTAQGVITDAISALNDLSTADVAGELATYDGPTKTELDTAIGTVTTAISGLNDISEAQVNTQAAAALTSYDPPTRTEATADKDAIIAALPTPSDATAAQQTAILAAITALNDPTVSAIVSGVLGTGVTTIEDTADDFSIVELILAALESSRSGTTMTIKKTDGVTTFNTRTLTVDANASAVTGVTD